MLRGIIRAMLRHKCSWLHVIASSLFGCRWKAACRTWDHGATCCSLLFMLLQRCWRCPLCRSQVMSSRRPTPVWMLARQQHSTHRVLSCCPRSLTLEDSIAYGATLFAASSGYLFGVVNGTMVVLISATIAAALSFQIGRTLLRSTVEQ